MLSNIYYLLRKTSKYEKVIEHLKMLMNIVDVLTTNKDAVLEALHSEFNYKTSNLAIMEPETSINLVKFSKP